MLRAALSILAVALTTAACTVVSGVDDLELRSSASPATTAPQDDAGTSDNPFAAGDSGAPEAAADIETPTGTGPATCGSQGSWASCNLAVTVTDCATICLQKGFTCVNSCCATDVVGDYDAKVGMVLALASECSLPSITSQATFGQCTTPIMPTVDYDVRCCCK